MSEVRLTVRVWWRCDRCGGYGDCIVKDANADALVEDFVPTHTCRAADPS